MAGRWAGLDPRPFTGDNDGMFGKFLLTVAVVAIVWFGFKFLARLAELKHGAAVVPPPKPRPERYPENKAEIMVECRVCGTWLPAGSAKPCGRVDCPY